ncbi:MAG: PqqD family protein [Ruminococcaceae bacterium]|nr:PqqD family protein [Oscillospiraceae bacterium]
MKKDKSQINYLEKMPCIPENLHYTVSDKGIVTLEVENKGVMNRILQMVLKKPKTSYVHLDEFGSFAFLCADGKRDIVSIGKLVEEKFGSDANPLYERLAKFFQILDSYNFIGWIE